VLIGRERECARIDELLDHARLGRSGALVIRGEPGIGKTALLDYAAAKAREMAVLRTLGVESEAELQFTALFDVCRSLVHHLDEIPTSQAESLRAAFDLGPAVAADRFAIGAATLGVLAAEAERLPVLVLVDDAQWLDSSSADALLFATRRLQADRVAVVYAVREGEGASLETPGIESITLRGLSREESASLLQSSDVATGVVERLYEATRGNPLALLELPNLLSREQLSGQEPLGDPLPAGSSVEKAFARRAEALPAQSRQALLIAAVSSSGHVEPIVAALESLGIGSRALEPIEDAGLASVTGERLVFRHPLVRSAAYQVATPSERRRAHRVLAGVLVGSEQAETRAWHLAAAALGADEEAARALQQAAEQGLRRSGYAAASSALEQAARLSPERDVGLERLAAAADAAWRAGRTKVASELVAETLKEVRDARIRAESLRLQGNIEYMAGRADAAATALLQASALWEVPNPSGAVAAAADAVNALVRVGEHARALEAARRARSLAPPDGGPIDLEATVALGFALWLGGDHLQAEPHLRRALEVLDTGLPSAGPLQAARLAAIFDWLGRYEHGRAFLAGLVERAREVGAVGSLPALLALCSWQALHAGRWNEAYADAGEALELSDALDQPVAGFQALGALTWLHALRGDEERCLGYVEATRRRSAAVFGMRQYEHLVYVCLGLLDLGAGRVDAAIANLEQTMRYADERGLSYIPGVAAGLELAETYLRAGRTANAQATLSAFESAAAPHSAPLLAALLERTRALLADADSFDTAFLRALELHARVECPFALARTQLSYGERLRRAGRRVEAREQLRLALEFFERVGAHAWVEMTRKELRASGERLRRREVDTTDQLTPQELQIALQVAEGKTNKEVGATLFLSHKTVEFHLSRIYRKLDMTSRAELIRRFASDATAIPS
jgi:DNA-binding CsgD family transcriptional regulator